VEALRAQTVAQAARIAELEAEVARLKVYQWWWVGERERESVCVCVCVCFPHQPVLSVVLPLFEATRFGVGIVTP
jgi:hypothetical protein